MNINNTDSLIKYVAIGFVVIVLLFMTVFTVSAGERGVLLTFGKPSMDSVEEGLHFKIPFGLVINKWDINKTLSNKIQKWAGRKFLGKISYDKEIFKAVDELRPIMETNLKSKKEIEKIFNKLCLDL